MPIEVVQKPLMAQEPFGQILVDQVRNVNERAVEHAVSIFAKAISGPKMYKLLKNEKSELYSIVSDMKKNPENYAGKTDVKFGQVIVEGEKGKKAARQAVIYSIRAEIKGVERIITLRVGGSFTEMSLEKQGRLAELVREESKEIRFEKFA